MTNRRALVTRCAALLAASAFVLTWHDVRAQQRAASDDVKDVGKVLEQPDDAEQPADQAAQQAAQLAEMKSVVKRLYVFESQDDQRRKVDIVEKPLLHFRDEVRRHLDGTFWVWGRKGRPVATGEIWSNRPETHVWYVAMVSTTTNLTGCDVDDQPHWMPKTAGVSFTKLPSKARPSKNSTLVQTQMRSLARRFSAANTDLRLLSRPVHSYQDPKNDIVAGAVFVFVHGTNPEIILLIEAVKQDSGTDWQYALTRSSSGPLAVQLDGKKIWSLPELTPVTGLRDEPFRILMLKAEPQPRKPDKID